MSEMVCHVDTWLAVQHEDTMGQVFQRLRTSCGKTGHCCLHPWRHNFCITCFPKNRRPIFMFFNRRPGSGSKCLLRLAGVHRGCLSLSKAQTFGTFLMGTFSAAAIKHNGWMWGRDALAWDNYGKWMRWPARHYKLQQRQDQCLKTAEFPLRTVAILQKWSNVALTWIDN